MACKIIRVGAAIHILLVCIMSFPIYLSAQDAYWDFSVRGGYIFGGERLSLYHVGVDAMLGSPGVDSFGAIISVDFEDPSFDRPEGVSSNDRKSDRVLYVSDYTFGLLASYSRLGDVGYMATFAVGPFVSIPGKESNIFDDNVVGLRMWTRLSYEEWIYIGHRFDLGPRGRRAAGLHIGIIVSSILKSE